MASMTKDEILLQLTQVNAAIDLLLQGKTISELRLGSNEFSRLYKYNSATLAELQTYRRELLDALATLEPEVSPTFRSNAIIPLVVRKGVL